jgi:hypothetical protein
LWTRWGPNGRAPARNIPPQSGSEAGGSSDDGGRPTPGTEVAGTTTAVRGRKREGYEPLRDGEETRRGGGRRATAVLGQSNDFFFLHSLCSFCENMGCFKI